MEVLKPLDLNLLRTSLEFFIDKKRFIPFITSVIVFNVMIFDSSKARSQQLRQFSSRA